MKKILFFVAIFTVCAFNLHSQVVVGKQNFDSIVNWTVSPSNSWVANTSYYVSSPKSYHGYVPNQLNDSIMLTTPFYDFSQYKHVWLSFSHICKIAGSDIAHIEMQESHTGAQWKKIPSTCYLGSNPSAYAMQGFNHNSYSDWQPSDSLVTPNNSWWKEERFDISAEAGWGNVRFRFKLKRGTTVGTQFAYGWLIDNFEVRGGQHELDPPILTLIPPILKDTVYGVGPFDIRANVIDAEDSLVKLSYTINGGTPVQVVMKKENATTFSWTIPQQVYGTNIAYTVRAEDSVSNSISESHTFVNVRHPSSPNNPNGAAMYSIDTPYTMKVVANVSLPVYIKIKNTGLNNLTSATVYWSVNGVLKTSYNWTGGNLPVDFASSSFYLGSYTPSLGYDTIKVWVKNPNGVADPIVNDDTLSFITFGCNTIFSGVYTIGGPSGSRNFTSITAALNELSFCGMSGNTTFRIYNGTYNENINFTAPIEGMGQNDTITFISSSGKADSVIIYSTSSAVTLSNVFNFVFKKITLNVVNGNYGIHFTGPCDNIIIDSCIIKANPTTTSTNKACIYKSSSGVLTNIRITNNILDGGYYNIYFWGGSSSTVRATNTVFNKNTLANAYYYAAYFYYTNFSSLSGNSIRSRTANTASYFYGLHMYYCDAPSIVNNKVYTPITIPYVYAMYIAYCNNGIGLNPVLVANNELRLQSIYNSYGIYVTSSKINIYHNSVLAVDVSNTTNIGVYISSSSGLNVKNNNLVTTVPIYLANLTSLGNTWFMDYNNYYSPLGYIGYANGFIQSMSAWRTATSQDIHSISVYPPFKDTSINLKTNGGSITCKSISDVSVDITGASRGLMTTMGAYHDFSLVTNNVMPYRLYAPSDLTIIGGNDSVVVSIVNIGSNIVTSMKINWIVNGVTMPQYSWTGSLSSGDTTLPIKLGNFVPQIGDNEIIVYTSLPNNSADQVPQNDTIKTSTYGCDSLMTGTYIIGGAGGDFATINDALIRLKYCGISGPVTFAIEPGVYVENIIFEDTIRGADSINTVTFTSITGVRSDVIIYTARDSAQDVGTVDLKNVKHLIFRNISIYGQHRSPMYYSKAVMLRTGTSNIEFNNCILLIPTFVSATNIPGQLSTVYNPSGNQIDDIRILNCLVRGGSAGIYLMGIGDRITIKNNEIIETDNCGIYLYYNNFNEISNNYITQRYTANLTLVNFYGIYLYQSQGDYVRNNKIHLYQTEYGMYLNYATKLNNSHLLIYNNEIIAPVLGSNYGIYMTTGCNDIKILHNSVLIKGNGDGKAMYVATSLNNNVIRNNNFVNLSGNSSSVDNYAIYFPNVAATNSFTMDYNNYYTIGSYMGYAGSNITNLTLWKTAVGKDGNSMSINPTFFSNQTLNLVDYTGLGCPLISDVPIDIDSMVRTVNTTIGAYHGDPYALDVMPRVFISPGHSANVGVSTPVTVTVLNVGKDTVSTMYINWIINGVLQTPYLWTGTLLPNATTSPITLGNFLPQAGYNSIIVYTSMPNGLADNLPANDTIEIETFGCSTGYKGTYSVGLIGADFTSLDAAIEALSYCGVVGPTTIAIKAGTYRGNVIIPAIPGASPTNTITFTSAAKDSTTVVLQGNLATGVIILDNANDIIISHLTLEGILSGSASRCVELKNKNRNILITNNFMETCQSTYASSAIMAVYSSMSQDTNVVICNNHMYGTGGIWFESANYLTSASYNISIENNTLDQFYYYGIYLSHTGIAKVHRNRLYKSDDSPQGYGLYMNYCYGVTDKMTEITANTIIGGYNYVAYLYECYSNNGLSTADILFANNELIQVGSSGTYMMYQYRGGKWQNINNSILNIGVCTYMININTAQSAGLNFSNNIIANLGTCTYPFYSASVTATYIGNVDYNDYWKGNATGVAYWGAAYTDLPAWKAAHTNINAHSIAIHPVFLDSTKKAVPSIWTGLQCPASPLVTKDIVEINRSHITSMGCYVPIYNLDAGLKEFISPLGSSTINQTNIIVKLTNWGYNTLNTATIQWKVNGVAGTAVNLTNLNLGQYKDTNILLGTYLPVLGSTTNLIAWVENPNGNADQNLYNDTIAISSLGCNRILKGNYSVGGASADFTNIAQVFLELTTCGIDGNVTFNILSGTYTENMNFNASIPGMTIKDTITFTSQAKNKDSVILKPTGVAISLANVYNIIFKDLSIDATNGTHGIMLNNSCENIEINHCNIKLNPTNTGYAGIYKPSGTSVANNIRILNNTIEGGTYNIYFYGGTGTSDYANNISIEGNTLKNAYQYGAYLYYNKLSSISNNTITSRLIGSSSVYYGLYISHSNVKIVNANKIHTPTTITTPYGIYAYYTNYYNASSAGLISNNEIILRASSANGHGMYCYYGKLNIYHNSIHLITSAAAKGLYVYTLTNYPISIRQNNIGSSSSMAYPIYLTSLNGLTLNNNNYYGSYIGYINTGISNMSLWKMATGQDVNSTNINPNFVDVNVGLKTDGLGLTCVKNNEVQYDITGAARGIITTVGAYNDFIILPYNIMPKTLESPALTISSSVSDSIYVTIANMGANTITFMNIHWQLNNGVKQTISWSGNLNVLDVTPPIFLGTFMPNSGSNHLLIYTDSPNGHPDDDASNDTMSVEIYACDSSLSGTYTVGGSSANFASINDAVKALSYCGISAPTTLLINPNTYTENITIPNIPGSSSTHTVTLTSATGDSSSVIIQSPSDKACLTLVNANNIIIRNLTINGVLNGKNSHAINLKNNNRNIVIRNNKIQTSTDTNTSEAIAAIYSYNSSDTNLSITNNYLHGSGGIWIESSTTTHAPYNISINNNTIDQFHHYGIYTSNANIYTISNNKLYKNESLGGYGIYMDYSYGIQSDITRITNNKVIGSFNILAYFNYCYSNHGTTTTDILLANNEFINKGNGTYIVYQYYGGRWQNINNTFLNTNTASVSNMFDKYSNVTNGINFTNNIFVNLGTANYLIYVTTPTYVGNVDYNNYYTTSSNLVYWGSSYNSLSNWQTAYPALNINSSSVDPSFANPSLNAIPSSWLGLVCPRNPNVLRDISGVTRGQNTYMGCYVPVFDFDASLESFVTPVGSSIAGSSTPVSVKLSNAGTTVLTSVTIAWKVNSTTMGQVNVTGLTLSQFQDTVIYLGTYVPINNVTATIVAWIENPNGQAIDSNQANDTIETKSLGCAQVLNGSYTVGNTSADFASLTDAFTILNTCGVSGPVVLNMLPGTYSGLTINKSFVGCSQTNTLTITSSTGRASDVVFQSTTNALALGNTSDIIFKNLTFDATTGTRAVQFNNACENIEINSCIIKANSITTSTSYAGIYKASTGVANNIRIINNSIDGGYYNIYFYGGVSSTDYGTNIVIEGNTLSNAYYYGAYLYYTNFNSISNNIITSRSSNVSSYYYGVRLYYCNVLLMNGNDIRSTNTAIRYPYGIHAIYLNYYNTSTPGKITNNDIILTTTSNYAGIYLTYARVHVLHNSILMNGTSGDRCVYLDPIDAYYVSIKNNNFVSTSASGYGIYLANTTTLGTYLFMDYNNFYTAYIGYASGNINNLSAWRGGTGQDAHSVTIYPQFVDITKDLRLSDYIGLMCPKDNNILIDHDNKQRTSLTVMGAYSVSLYEDYDLSATFLVEPINIPGACYPDYISVKLAVANNGIYPFNFALTPLKVHVDITGAINYQHDTIISSGGLNEMKQDTFEVATMIPANINGDYHITVWLSCPVDTIYSDDTLRSTYTVNRINLPFDEDFSTIPLAMKFNNMIGSLNWEIIAGSEMAPPLLPVYGSGSLRFASSSGRGSMAQAITEPLDLQGTYSPKLEFWYAHDNQAADARDQINIYISVDGGLTFTSLINLFRYDSTFTSPAWKYYRVDLSAYSLYSCAVFAIEAQSYGGADQYIDRIRISAAPDVKISKIDIPNLKNCDLKNKTIKVIVENNTSQTFDFSKNSTTLYATYKNPDGQTQNFNFLLNSKILNGGDQDTLILGTDFDLSSIGAHTINAYFNTIDSNRTNDTLLRNLNIFPDAAITYLRSVDPKNIGDTVYASAWVKNTGTILLTEIPIRLQINNANDIVEIVYATLNPGDSIYYTFKKGFIVPQVGLIQPYYQLSVKTELACDADASNNRKIFNGQVNVIDISLTKIEKPTENDCDTGLRHVYVKVELTNNGATDQAGVRINVLVDSAGTVFKQLGRTVTVHANTSESFEFATSYIVPNIKDSNETYTVTAFINAVKNDYTTDDDTLSVKACVVYNPGFKVIEILKNDWYVNQNQPNPASNITIIDYFIPQSDQVIFKIITIKGQVLYQDVWQANNGENKIQLTTDFLANGIYYYSLEYQGRTIVKKMTINK
ncbi:MAG: right-handed parallel beta-helix repeat-containing protein [Bacteroidales bacterium]